MECRKGRKREVQNIEAQKRKVQKRNGSLGEPDSLLAYIIMNDCCVRRIALWNISSIPRKSLPQPNEITIIT